MEEFERIFSELFFSPHKRMSRIASNMVKEGKTAPPSEPSQSNPPPGGVTEGSSPPNANNNQEGACALPTEPRVHDPRSNPAPGSFQRSVAAGGVRTVGKQERASYRIPRQSVKMAASKRRSLHEDSIPQLTPHEETELEHKMGQLQSSLKRVKQCIAEEGDKLFSDLLDDLDNISQVNTGSARRRRKARDIFSDWVFSSDSKTPEIEPHLCSSVHELHANPSAYTSISSSRRRSNPTDRSNPMDGGVDHQWQRRRKLLERGSTSEVSLAPRC